MEKVAVIHGPNINLLGKREPEIYGLKTLKQVNEEIYNKADELNIKVEIFQSNYEGEIVEFIQNGFEEFDGIVINPAGLTHYSIVLRDALTVCRIPVIEVHISNIFQRREEFRHKSVISPIAAGMICGLGTDGYIYALQAVIKEIKKGGL